MSGIGSWIVSRVKETVSFTSGILKDRIVYEHEVESFVGKGFLFCQLRERSNGERYIIFKSKGGDATVWVGVSMKEVENLIRFLENNYLHKRTDGDEWK